MEQEKLSEAIKLKTQIALHKILKIYMAKKIRTHQNKFAFYIHKMANI